MAWKIPVFCIAALAFLSLGGAPRAGEAPLEIAITFDDLPTHSEVPAGVSRADLSRAFIKAQKLAGAPPMYGFLNAWPLDKDPYARKALRLWRRAGNLLGNHTFSHLGATKQTPAAFAADIEKNEPYLKAYMAGENWHYLRLPYLDMGNTAEKRAANYDGMLAHGYRLADVSMGFNVWDYNSAYLRCKKQGNRQQIHWLKHQYMLAVAHSLKRGREDTNRVWGHQIRHIYLLHFGALDSKMFGRVLAYFHKHDVRLITLPEAMKDPVYAKHDLVIGNWGGYLPDRVAAEKHITLPPEPPDLSGDKLAAVCRITP